MADLYTVAAGEVAQAEDVNQYKDALEGASEQQFALKQKSGADFTIQLPDAAGASKVAILDSGQVEVASIDSDGRLVAATDAPTVLILPSSTSPAQTAEGSVIWDSDDDRLTIGDGSSRKTFYPGQAGWQFAGADTTERTMTSSTAADLSTVSSLNIPATAPIMIVVAFRKTANAFTPTIGLKVNSTVVIEAAYTLAGIGNFANTNEAQNGASVVYIAPRRTNYDRGVTGHYQTGGATAGEFAVIPDVATAPLTNAIPVAAVTSISIRGDSDGTNTLGVHGVYVYYGAES